MPDEARDGRNVALIDKCFMVCSIVQRRIKLLSVAIVATILLNNRSILAMEVNFKAGLIASSFFSTRNHSCLYVAAIIWNLEFVHCDIVINEIL